jgi:hypothetical protein
MISKVSVNTTQTRQNSPRGKQATPTAAGQKGSLASATPVTSGADPIDTSRDTGPTSGRPLAQATDGQTPVDATEASAPETKLTQLLALLRRPEGTTLAEMCAATGWQAHSVRGAMAGTLKRKGHVIASQKLEDVRRYRIEVVS